MFEQTNIRTKLKSNYNIKKRVNPLSESITFDEDNIQTKTKGGSSTWEEDCPPYTCVPPDEPIQCPDMDCPDEYEIEVLEVNDFGCYEFTCHKPIEDILCYISEPTFTTFDNTRYRYEICSHILAMDMIKNSWSIACK